MLIFKCSRPDPRSKKINVYYMLQPLIPPRRSRMVWGLIYDNDEFITGLSFPSQVKADEYILNKIGMKVLRNGLHILVDDKRNELRANGYRLGGRSLHEAFIEKSKITSARKRLTQS